MSDRTGGLCVVILDEGIAHGLEDYQPGMRVVAARWRGSIGILVEDVERALESEGPPSGTECSAPGLRKILSAEAPDISPLSDVYEKTG